MRWRWVGAVGLLGAGATVAVSVSFQMPAAEALRLAGLAGGAALAVGGLGAVLLIALRRRPLGDQATVLVLVAVATVGVGAMAAAGAMFISRHDLHSLLVILLAAGTVSMVVAGILGGRVAAAGRALGEAARRIGDGDLHSAVPAPAGGEFAALARDLEEMSRRLHEARERERALERSRRELTAWVSHDLRTPLAGIRAMSEALEDGVVSDPATVERYHRTLRFETERLGRLVDELFELSVIQAGALRLHLEWASLGDLVSDAISAAMPAADARHVRLEGRLEDRPVPEVQVSPGGVARVLRNLLENAIRHTPSDGSIVVTTGRTGAEAYVSVADGCGGIAGPDMARVFDPAFRGEAARTPTSDGGAGLGLAIARGIVEAHHGQISVRNEGLGCTFTIRLPLSQPMDRANAPQ
jgi:signal transduction histidine kinase